MNISSNAIRPLLLGALFACAPQTHAQSVPTIQGGSDPVVFETRPPGAAGGGIVIGDVGFPSHTFRLRERTQISALGLGNLGEFTGPPGATVFTALYQVDTPDTVPDVVSETGLLGVALLEVPATRGDVSGALSLIVEPGIYAIVSGTGRHGATAANLQASLENTGTGSTPDTWGLPYSVNAQTGARTLQNAAIRFFLEGQVLPPSESSPVEFLMETARATAWWTQSSISISNNFWFGTRFEISRPTRIDRVGSWLRSGSGQLFAAIIELSGPGANPLPVTHPGFMNTVAGTALIGVGGAPRAYTGEFENVELAAGHYALVIGTGMFGASGSAGIMGVEDELVIPGTLVWAGSFWSGFPESHRFFLTGLIPELSITPGPADFGSVPIGESGVETITITNLRDDADLQVSDIGVGGTGFSLHPDASNCAVATIDPGDDCRFTVLFNPAETGEKTGILQVWSDGEPSPFEVELTGNGIAPALDLDPGVFEFEIHQGDADTATLSVGNTGEADLHWSVMISEAPLAAGTRNFQEIHEGFENVSQLPAAGWVRINNSEPPGTPGWFQGGSYPAHQGPTNSYISAAWHNTEGPNGVISNWLLTPEFDLSEGVQLRFWTRVPTNSCCPDRLEVRLSTAGDSTDVGDSEFSIGDFTTRLLTVNEALVQGGYPQQWTEFIVTVPAQGASTGGRFAFRYFVTEAGSQSPNSNWLSIDTVSIVQWDGGPACTGPAEIPWLSVFPDAGTTPPDTSSGVDISINTSGLAEGEYSAQLCVSSNDPDTPLAAVPVGLTVLPPRTPELVFDPATLDFSDVNIGATGGPLTATLSNIGNADATGLSLALSGDFGLNLNDCGNALPAGGDCQVGIVFAPTEEGTAAGILEATADDGFSATLVLSGNGVDAPAPALEFGPESFAFELFPEQNDSRELVIGNLGAGDLIWSLETDLLGILGPRGHAPSLDEPIAIPDFEIDSAANGGQPAVFTLPAGEISRGEVVGLSFAGTVSGITGTSSAAREMCMFVTAPDGTSFAVGGFFSIPGCGLPPGWDFHGPDDGTYESHFDNIFSPPVQDSGAWTFTFHNGWNSSAAATMAWSDVTITLHKIPAPCLDPAAVDWLDVFPASGMLAPGNDDTVTVSVDTGGLSEGEHIASLCLSSNDLGTPLVAIPVALRVETPAPAIAVNPDSFEFEILQGGADGDALSLFNTGHADLEWNLFEPVAGSGETWVLLEEDFEGGFPPSGWMTADDGNLSCPWRTSDDYGLDGWSGTARGAAVDSDHCFPNDVPLNSVDASLISPPLNLAHVNNARVEFDLAYRQLGLSRLRLDISTDAGGTWTTLRTWSSHFAFPNNSSLPVSVDLSEYEGESHVLLRWRYRAGWDWWAYIDNVVVTGDIPDNCYDPALHSWLDFDPISGIVEPGGTAFIDLWLDTGELATGDYAAGLCILGNVPGTPLVVVPVDLSVVAPELTLDPSQLDFGEVPVGESGSPLTVTLTNTGNADLEIEDIAGPIGPFAPAGGTCDDAPFILPPGNGCQFDFVFSPAEIGKTTAVLSVASNAPSSPGETTLTGTGIAAMLAPDPASFSFALITGQSDSSMLAIGNAGNIDLDWTIAIGSNCSTGDFVGWLSATPAAGTTVPGGVTPVEVVADAQGLAAGHYEAVLCLSANALGAPQTEIPVSLSVIAPDLLFDPPVLDFGDVEISTGGLTLNPTLHNQGDSAATGLDFLVPAGFSADTGDCGDTLPAGENCQIAVTFDPSETGAVEGTLIVGGAKGVTAELALSGRGIEFGTLGIDPDQLHFADVVVTRSRTLSFSVTNTAEPGANDLEVSVISLQSGAPAFAISGIDCLAGTVLPPGESCVVEISFNPSQVAAHHGTVHIAASDGQQLTLALSGTVLGDDVFVDRFEQP